MPIQLIDNFELNVQKPIDNRFVVGGTSSFYATRYDIVNAYHGLRIWDLNDGQPYVYDGATWSSEATLTTIQGTGTANYLPKFNTSNSIENSVIYQNSGNIIIGTTSIGSPSAKLVVDGNIKANSGYYYYGSGLYLTALNATEITTGTLDLARLSISSSSSGWIMSRNSSSANWVNPNSLTVATASALGTTRTLWGQNFNGTSNVSGIINVQGSVINVDLLRFRNAASPTPGTLTMVWNSPTNLNQNLNIPNFTGSISATRTMALLEQTQTFTAAQAISGTLGTMLTVSRTNSGNNYTFLQTVGANNVGIFYENSSGARSLYMDGTGNLITGGNAGVKFNNFKLDANYLYLGGEGNYTPAIRISGGTASQPSYSFHGATNSGMYCDSGRVAFSYLGVRIARFDTGSAHDFTIYSPDGLRSSGLSVYNGPSNQLRTQHGLYVSGALSKASGSFRIQHPIEEMRDKYDLVHSFIEGPQADNIYRGTVILNNGKATVNLDKVSRMTEGTFVLLNRDVQCFTTNETGWILTKGKVTGNILEIIAETNCSDEISWMVIGERQDKHMFDTDWTDENGKVIVEPLK
jgi:hypothetical protein